MPTQWSEAEQVLLGCIAPPYNAFLSTVAPHQRQRRKKEVNASYVLIITTMSCERAV